MDYNFLSPFVRYAAHHTLFFPFKISPRVIFDYEIIFPEDGLCRLDYEGKTYICKAGDVIFIRPGHEHSLTGIDGHNFVQPHVHFDMTADDFSFNRYICFEKYSNLPEKDKQLLSRDIADVNIPTVFRPENPDYFKAQLYELIELFYEKGGFYQLLCKEKMLRILYLIFSQFNREKPEEHNKIEMLNIKSFIDGNYAQKITLDFLSQRFLMNKFFIEVNFQKHFGTSVIKYYNYVRFEHACKLLKSGKRVNEVADKLGYENIYSFSRAFKNIAGISPSEYKKSYTNEEF